ncbi:2461_t:CDS:2, partial [Acaulospora colombiana]
DSLKRYYELKGKKVLLSTGTDEHGLKIQQAAIKENKSPQEFCDQVSKRFLELFDTANISYTTFVRTTNQRHKETVKYFWNQLTNGGYIYKGAHEGWYSISDEAFYNASQVCETETAGGGRIRVAIESGQPVEWTTEDNYKFTLSKFPSELIRWLDDNPDVIVPSSRYNEVRSLTKAELSDLSVSRPRSRLNWGIGVPGDDEQVIYVWLDALVNYLTVCGYPWNTKDEGETRGFEGAELNAWPADVHVVGKDIIK